MGLLISHMAELTLTGDVGVLTKNFSQEGCGL
jgi:hypothetical protein